jgi:hypothetical protein
MEKREMLDALMTMSGYTTKRQLAHRLNIRDNTLGNWYSRNTFDMAVVSKAYPEVSLGWLMTGVGPMLRLDGKAFAELAKEIEDLKERIRILESIKK